MTPRRNFLAVFAAALVVALGLFLWLTPSEGVIVVYDRGTHTSTVTSVSHPSPLASKIEPAVSASPVPLEISHLADQLNSPTADIRADLKILADVLANFRSNFPHDGNPVGNNAEITATLTGRNKLRYAVIPPNHSAINQAGELCDRWGTPFFFHAESATKMGLRSAGPDKKMWTDDDIVVGP